jgi:hypothetical protein
MPAQKTVPLGAQKAPPPPPEKLAEAPFDNAKADLVLQSSDEVHFRVYKNILSLASPVFTDMFSLPSPPSQKPHNDKHNEIQMVTLSEHSTALDVALRHIYPVRTPKGDTLHYASILAEFARKYQMEALDRFITVYLTDSVERDPVGVYAIAVTYGYNDIGANAARTCLNLPFSGLRSQYMRCATAEHIAELFWYHVACGGAASALASSDRTWCSSLTQNGIFAPQRSGSVCGTCAMPDFIYQTPTSHDGPRLDDDEELPKRRSGPRCLWNYLHRSAVVLAHHPTAEAITTEAFVLGSNDCHACPQYSQRHMLEVSAVLGGEIKKAVQQVSLSPYPLSHVCDVQWYMLIRGRFRYLRLFPWDQVAPIPIQIDRECKYFVSARIT